MKNHGPNIALLGTLLILLICLFVPGMAKVIPDTSENVTGVWSTNGMNVHSFVEKDGQVFESGVSHDLAILVNPEIIGDRMYFTPEMMARYEKSRSENGRPFFYRDQLYKPKCVYRIKADAQVYILHKEYIETDKGLIRITPDSAVHTFISEGSNPYLIDPKVIMNHESPKVLLDYWHGGEAEWNYDPANPPPAARFIWRHQLELLNP